MSSRNWPPSTLFIDPINSTTYYNFCFVKEMGQKHSRFIFLTSRFIYDETLKVPENTKYFFFKISNSLSKFFKNSQKPRRFLRALEYPFNLLILLYIIYYSNVSIIHYNYSIVPRLERIFLKLCKKMKCKIILNAHNALPHDTGFRYKSQYQKLYQEADVIVTLTEYVKNTIQKGLEVFRPKYKVIPHGDMNYIFNQVKEEKGLDYIKPTIVLLGSINPYKGLFFLLKSVSLVLKNIDIKLIVIGIAREPMKKYYDYAMELGIHDHIEWATCYLNLSNMYRKLQNTKIFVFPYEQASQSGGIITAFTLEKPVVIRPVGGLPEMIRDNIDGVIARSPHEMAEQIKKLIRDQDLYFRMKRNIRNHTKKRIKWENIIPDFIELYKS